MKKIVISSFLSVLVFLSVPAWAANFSDPVDGVFRGIYGNTISVEIPSLVSKSPVSGNQNGDVSFQVSSETAYTNFSQLTDLKYGDLVRVAYSEDLSGKVKGMTATSITNLGTTVVTSPMNSAGTITTVTVPNQNVTTTTTTTRINE